MVSCIIPTGFLISEFNLIGQAWAWGIGVNILAFVEGFLFRKISDNQDFNLTESLNFIPKRIKVFWQKQDIFSKATFEILGLGVFITAIINLLISFITYPNEWDSMTGHLVKCALYLQNGNMNRLQGTTWTIDFYPNSLPTLQMFFYHLLGEKGFKFIHYISYWLYVVSVYGITKKISPSSSSRTWVMLIAALIPTALVQATTTETDIVLTAYLGCVAYFMFAFREYPSTLNIVLLALMAGVFIGHKVTFLLISPAIFVVVIYTVLSKKEFYQKLKFFIPTFIVGIFIFVLPTGYIANVKEVGKFSLGSLSAPPIVMKWHGIEDYSTKDKVKNLALNTARYSSDFLNFDGIRGTEAGKKINDVFRIVPNKIFSILPIEGEKFTVVAGFFFDPPLRFYLERPYWGIISFGLLFPIIILLLFRKGENKTPYLILLSAAILHFLSLCVSAPYDPIKARYFLNMTIWALPLLAYITPSKFSKNWKVWSAITATIITISAICTILLTRLHPFFGEKTIFNTSRMEQLTVARPDVYEAYQKFDEIVPKDAIVALGTQQEHEDFEYPLWGKEFKRKLIPIHPFRSAVKPIPSEAEYLFYSKGVIPYQSGDIALGSGNKKSDTAVEESQFYLRKLK